MQLRVPHPDVRYPASPFFSALRVPRLPELVRHVRRFVLASDVLCIPRGLRQLERARSELVPEPRRPAQFAPAAVLEHRHVVLDSVMFRVA